MVAGVFAHAGTRKSTPIIITKVERRLIAVPFLFIVVAVS